MEPVVEFTDRRPEEEKSYYPGETDPLRWRDAMTILPMESFQRFELPVRGTRIRGGGWRIGSGRRRGFAGEQQEQHRERLAYGPEVV